MEKHLNLTLQVWRQKDGKSDGSFVDYPAKHISTEMSFLEMLDVVNEGLIAKGEEPIAFDHDCREGICGMCSMVINGIPHGPQPQTTACQCHMRNFEDGDVITIEPWRARAFPVIKDLVVDRSALDRIIAAGGYISASTGSAATTRDWSRPSSRCIPPCRSSPSFSGTRLTRTSCIRPSEPRSRTV